MNVLYYIVKDTLGNLTYAIFQSGQKSAKQDIVYHTMSGKCKLF